ncbi:MAG: hypothetical protein GY769_18690 [bacterium]|nr:hypothetical protein [bacterium]
MTPNDLAGAVILSAVFLGLLVAAELWRRLGNPKTESTRKLVHIGGGIACLFFPFLVRSPWVVGGMALALAGIFALAARTQLLPSLHAVERRSRGVEYYPIAVFLVFFLTQGRPWLYLSAILVLALGDASAALAGKRYGSVLYEVEERTKSLEGSATFLAVSFLALHLPMLLLTDLPREVCVLAALLVALLVTGFEAISLEGADNLFVPLAVVFVLGKITTKPVPEIVFQNLSLVAICVVMALLVRRYPFFNVGAAIAVVLFSYANWSLGSWVWAVPVLAGVAVYLVASMQLARGRAPRLRVRTVARALIPLFLILVVANAFGQYRMLFGPYLAACGSVLAFSLANPVLRLERLQLGPRLARVALVALITTAATALFSWMQQPDWPFAMLLVHLAVIFGVTSILTAWEARPAAVPLTTWSASRVLLSLAAGGFVLALQILGLATAWNPTP